MTLFCWQRDILLARRDIRELRPLRGLQFGLLVVEPLLVLVQLPGPEAADAVGNRLDDRLDRGLGDFIPNAFRVGLGGIYRGVANLFQRAPDSERLSWIAGKLSGLPPSTSTVVRPAITPSIFVLASS
jgi:hypothetical protein